MEKKRIVTIQNPNVEGETIDITITKLKFGTLGKIIHKVSNIAKKMNTNKEYQQLIVMSNSPNKELSSSMLMLVLPQLLGDFFDEVVDLLADVTNLDVETVENLDSEDVMSIIEAFFAVNSIEEIQKQLKNFGGRLFKKSTGEQVNDQAANKE